MSIFEVSTVSKPARARSTRPPHAVAKLRELENRCHGFPVCCFVWVIWKLCRFSAFKMVFDVSNKDFPRTPGRGAVAKTWQKSKFEKQREEEVIRNAHERGYLRAPTVDDVWESIGEKCDLGDISYLNMSGICLHTVRTIDLCTRLRICVLHSNYISSFDSLVHCRELFYLDLHNNQVRFNMITFV